MKIVLFPPLGIHELGHRDNQEDALWPLNPTTENKLFVLCDGMGGHEHGEVASQTVSQAIGDWYNSKAVHPLNKAQVEDAIAYAYAKLDEKDGGEFRKMGTTLTLLYIGRNGALAAHMGDSRIYHIRPGLGVLYQSRDHSLVFDLFQSGEITYEEMGNFAQKNIVTRAMTPGEDNRMRPDMIQITDIQPGDYFYMCSDGMLEQMSNDELVSVLSSNASDEKKHQQLIAATTDNQDNHTAWLIHIKDVVNEEGDKQLENEEPTSRCNALNIIPHNSEKDDVKIVKDDDVVVIATPSVRKKKISFIKKMLSLVLIILLVIIACFLYFRGNCKEIPKKTDPTIQAPIKQKYHKSDKKNDNYKDELIKEQDESEYN